MLNWIKSLSRAHKRMIMVCIDSALIPLALLVTLTLQMPPTAAWELFVTFLPALPYLLAVVAGLSVWMGISSVNLNQYEGNAIGMSAIYAALSAAALVVLTSVMPMALPSSVHIVFGASFFVFVVISRALLLQVVLAIYRSGDSRCRVLIYGAGTTGGQLVSAFRSHAFIEPIAFVDDNTALQGM